MRRYGRTGDPDFNLDQPHSLLVKVSILVHGGNLRLRRCGGNFNIGVEFSSRERE